VRFDDIVTQLHSIAEHEKLDADDTALALLAEAGDGSMRDALSIMDQAIASAPVAADGRPHLDAAQIRELMGTVPNTVFERLLESIGENDSAAVMTGVDTLLNAGNSPSQLARQLVRYLRNTLLSKLGGESTELLQISGDERARVARTAMLFSEEDLARFLQIMLRSFDELNYRQEPRFHLELGLLKLVHTQRLIPLEQLMSQLPGGQVSGGQLSDMSGGGSRPSAAPPRTAASASSSSRAATTPATAPRSVVSSEATRGGSVTTSTSSQPTPAVNPDPPALL
jgi:DNA polymerase-3 subunit gamma/tau